MGNNERTGSGWATANRFVEDHPILAVLIATAMCVALSLLVAVVEDRGPLGALRLVGWNAIAAGSMFAFIAIGLRANDRARSRK